jgi:hypothetical protein
MRQLLEMGGVIGRKLRCRELVLGQSFGLFGLGRRCARLFPRFMRCALRARFLVQRRATARKGLAKGCKVLARHRKIKHPKIENVSWRLQAAPETLRHLLCFRYPRLRRALTRQCCAMALMMLLPCRAHGVAGGARLGHALFGRLRQSAQFARYRLQR